MQIVLLELSPTGHCNLIHALLENGEKPVKVFQDNTVFANGRELFSVFSCTMVQVPESIA